MNYVQLGKRGPRISTVGFGAWAIGGRDWGPTDDEVSKKALSAALDGGVTFIDTVDVYGFGHSEELIAAVLKERGYPGEVVVATKAGNDFHLELEKSTNSTHGRIRTFPRLWDVDLGRNKKGCMGPACVCLPKS